MSWLLGARPRAGRFRSSFERWSSSSIASVLSPSEVRSLVESASSGDSESWDRLVDTYAGLVWSVIRAHNFYGAEAADIAQTVWLRCVEHLDRIREPERLAAWLATTARHECFRVSRRAGRTIAMEELPETVPSDQADGPGVVAVIASDDVRAVGEALQQIPERCRRLLRLLVAEPPVSYDDISVLMEMPKGSIGPTRSRCLARLRHALAEMGAL